MDDTAKYLIHAAITADGVVERSDVVGAVFGQTEGLLGDDLDLRDLQQSSKVGRIDVQIESRNGQSYGEITIASSLDRVETAILAASLETIGRVGPCRATVEVTDIEDVRAAKRREVVERAKELLSESFDDPVMDSREILEEVREADRVEDVTEFAGYPAGPHIESSDAIVVVEGRADVLNLLRYGIKNAVAVEGTNVPDAIADLTQDRTVTAFLDGDRGGELILRELAQVGEVDYVAFAPEGRSVEDLARHEVMTALREKVTYETVAERSDGDSAVAATDGSAAPAPGDPPVPPAESPEATDAPAAPTPHRPTDDADAEPSGEPTGDDAAEDASADDERADSTDATEAPSPSTDPESDARSGPDSDADSVGAADAPPTLRDHVREVVETGTGSVRLLDESSRIVEERDAADAFDAVEAADDPPRAVILDDELSQRLLDVAAQRGIERIVARSTGEFVKQPVGVRVLTADRLLEA